MTGLPWKQEALRCPMFVRAWVSLVSARPFRRAGAWEGVQAVGSPAHGKCLPAFCVAALARTSGHCEVATSRHLYLVSNLSGNASLSITGSFQAEGLAFSLWCLSVPPPPSCPARRNMPSGPHLSSISQLFIALLCFASCSRAALPSRQTRKGDHTRNFTFSSSHMKK